MGENLKKTSNSSPKSSNGNSSSARSQDSPTGPSPQIIRIASPKRKSFSPPPVFQKTSSLFKSLKGPGKASKTKLILSLLGIIFLVVTIPLTVFLVKQRVEYIPRAYPGQPCITDADCEAGEYCDKNGQCQTIPTPTPVPPTPTTPPSPTPTPGEGFCGTCSPSKSPGWIPGAPGPVDCNGTKCNDGSRNYCCWDDNNDGVCDMCATGQTPEVNCSGTCITFTGMQGQSVKFCEHYANHDVSCPYGISNPNCYTTTIPSNSYTKCIPDNKCGQLEANNYCGVCKPTGCGPVETPTPPPPPTSTPTPTHTPTPTPTPSPTPTPPTLCLDLTSSTPGPYLEVGQLIDLTCVGSSWVDNPITYVEFRFSVDDIVYPDIYAADANLVGEYYQGSIDFTIPATGVYRFECRVCTGSYCTVWGQAQ